MTIQKNVWEPDTCDCTIEYKWDDSLPPEQIVPEISFVKKSCANHKNLLPNEVVTYSCIVDENRKKNRSLEEALAAAPQQLADIFTDESGNQYYQLKNNIAFVYSFSGTAPNRILTIEFVGASLNNNQKNAIQNKLNNIFGSGVVVIK